MDPEVLINATQAFVLSMRRSWITQNGVGQCPVQALEAYPPLQRQALMAAIGAAISVAQSGRRKSA